MNKINIIFDGKILIDQFLNAAPSRSGVFFVALNVLQNFAKNKTYHITLTYINEFEDSVYFERFDKLKKITPSPLFCCPCQNSFRTWFSHILNLGSYLEVKDHVSHPYT